MGDVRPMVALGSGLQKRGCNVRIVTHAEHQKLVEKHRLEFAPIHINIRELLADGPARAWVESGSNPLGFFRAMREMMLPLIEQFNSDCIEGSRDAALILYNNFGAVGHDIAESMGAISFPALVTPVSPTSDFAHFAVPQHWALPRSLRLFSYTLLEQATWQMFRSKHNEWRQKALGLSKLPVSGTFALMRKRNVPMFYGFSEAVVERPDDWRDSIHMAGYWRIHEDKAELPDDLNDFITAGSAPIYVGFGSVSGSEEEAIARFEAVRDALERLGRRGVLTTGWGGLDSSVKAGDDLFVLDSIPHDALFPRMAAVVHAGGAGTTGTGLRAGVPNVIVPHWYDQFFWGHRVHQKGAGPKPIPAKKLTADALYTALEEALNSRVMQAAAKQIGARLRSEDGVAAAADIIQRLL